MALDLILFNAGKVVVPPPPTPVPVATMTAGTGSVKMTWTVSNQGTNPTYQYQIGAQNPPADGIITNTTSLFATANATVQQYGRVRVVGGNWSDIVTATPVILPTDPADPATFSPDSWDFAANTGPKAGSLTSTLLTPVFHYGPNSAVTTPGTIKGVQGGFTVNNGIPINLKNTSRTNDVNYGYNIDDPNVSITDAQINVSLNFQPPPAGTKSGPAITRMRLDTVTSAILPTQGSAYNCYGTFDYCDILSYYDGAWPGSHTRNIVLANYQAGDFSSPYGTRFRYSWMHGNGKSTYGKAKYNPVYFNLYNDPKLYPLKEVGATVLVPMTDAEISGSAGNIASITTGLTFHIGDYICPAPGYETQHVGINGGRWQVIGRTGDPTDATRVTGASAIGLPVTIGTDMPSWPHNSQIWTDLNGGNSNGDPFVSGNAILLYIGWTNHQDCNQVGSSEGHVLHYRCKLDNFTNSTWLITQPTGPPPVYGTDTAVDPYDPRYWPASYYTALECMLVAANNQDGTQRSKILYPQGAVVTDPVTGVAGTLPAYGYKSFPRWITIKNCRGIDTLGKDIAQGHTIYADGKGKVPIQILTEARRYQGVLDQMTTAGQNSMAVSNGGTTVTGVAMTATNADGSFTSQAVGLQTKMRELEFRDFDTDSQTNIMIPTDGYNGTPDNITNQAVFQNRLGAKMPKMSLDARGWLVLENNTSKDGKRAIDFSLGHPDANPWADTDGFYRGSA